MQPPTTPSTATHRRTSAEPGEQSWEALAEAACALRWDELEPARVTITTVDGRRQSQQIDHPYGAYPNQPTPADLESKFVTLTWARDPAALYQRLLAVGDSTDVATLFDGVA